MTVAVLIVSAFLSAWGRTLAWQASKQRAYYARTVCLAVHYMFGAIAIGAGIQLLFRG